MLSRSQIRQWFWPTLDPYQCAEHVEAVKYADEFEPLLTSEAIADYAKAHTFAADNYKTLVEITSGLDRKAEWTLGLAGAVAALVMHSAFNSSNRIPLWTFFPSLFALVWSMNRAICCRMPQPITVPFPPRQAIDLIQRGSKVIDAWAAISFDVARSGLLGVNSFKAGLVRSAGQSLVFGVLLLTLPAIAQVANHFLHKATVILPVVSPS